MSDFSYENFLMRFSYVFAFLAFIVVLLYAFLLEVARDEDGQNQSFQQRVIEDLGENGTVSLPLNKPHRTNKELQNWVNKIVSESLSFDALTYVENKNRISHYFNSAGMMQYESYLNDSGVLKSLSDNSYKMSLFAEDKPLLLNGGEVNGVYRWLYQIPVTISFLPRGSSDFSRIRNKMVNKKITLRLQVRRVLAAENSEEIQVESWTVTGRR